MNNMAVAPLPRHSFHTVAVEDIFLANNVITSIESEAFYNVIISDTL